MHDRSYAQNVAAAESVPDAGLDDAHVTPAILSARAQGAHDSALRAAAAVAIGTRPLFFSARQNAKRKTQQRARQKAKKRKQKTKK
jgi:hypothetical protein